MCAARAPCAACGEEIEHLAVVVWLPRFLCTYICPFGWFICVLNAASELCNFCILSLFKLLLLDVYAYEYIRLEYIYMA